MEALDTSRDLRRAEMADLLRSRRRQLTAERAGLPARARRRTPGLRREDVAELAGISVALYTWLEQGRDVPVSLRVIDAVATALQLSAGERAHLHRLMSRETGEVREELTPALQLFVDTLRGPAFVIDRSWNIVHANVRANEVFGGPSEAEEHKNMLVSLFTDESRLSLFVDFETVARSVVEMFRLDYADRIDDPQTQEMVELLRTNVPGFAAAWQDHRVREYPEGVRELDHPKAGRLKFVPSMFVVSESPGLRIFAFTPFDDLTAERVDRLVCSSPGRSTFPASMNRELAECWTPPVTPAEA